MNAMMVQSDLYIHGAETQRMAIVKMVMSIAERIGIDTADYVNPNNSAWQNWTAMVIYEVVENNA